MGLTFYFKEAQHAPCISLTGAVAVCNIMQFLCIVGSLQAIIHSCKLCIYAVVACDIRY